VSLIQFLWYDEELCRATAAMANQETSGTFPIYLPICDTDSERYGQGYAPSLDVLSSCPSCSDQSKRHDNSDLSQFLPGTAVIPALRNAEKP